MAYKTILVHLDKKEKALNRIRIAGNLAKTENAHLIGVATIGISMQTFQEASIDERDPALASHLKFLAKRAEGFVREFEQEMQAMGVLSYEGRVADGEAIDGINMLARYSDLVVIGRSSPDEVMPHAPKAFPEFVVLHAGRPVLLIPSRYGEETVGSRVLVAWDASKQARRAVSDAISILKSADVVDVVMFNVDNEADLRDKSFVASDFAAYLARHDVNVNVLQPRQAQHIGQALLEVAAEQQSDLLVLGGYGQTRFRDFLLGSVTRSVLSDAAIPVLMSH